MSKSDEARKRKLAALAQGESNVRERLLTLRGELDVLARGIDRLVMPARRPRLIAGNILDLALTGNLTPFARRKSRRRQP
jgi:hypothetical protein